MTLTQATELAIRAVDAGDLNALASALEARRRAIRLGERPTQEVLDAGERILSGLRDLERQLVIEDARLGQVRRYLEFRK